MQSLDDRSTHEVDDNLGRDARHSVNAVDQQESFSVSLPDGGRGRGVYKSIKTVVLSKKFNLLIPFGPLAIVVQKTTGQNVSFYMYHTLFFVDRVVQQCACH